ncbi:MAG: hypothetical protein A2921_01585 [Candidatus Magasanikbacteria bacterium RIFCSPLOWO2_01_FULL_43_20b]|nr:MAG: hypothetical protein A3C74_01325 [Candidatus Magasanikbacteria bacterium RIFCSPHIGHO2_02_FULL_44_13]OGH72988.1 MAG: hypothetical protein A2921_01585 [Candidatus Magasanikbacteria bacterium RIFCSPLOWO2_01_FULL_43_20b]
MTPRTKHTSLAVEQPVRLYKFIALSFLILTIILLGVIIFMSAKRATITVVAGQEPLEVSVAMAIGSESKIGFVETITVELKKTYKPESTKEIGAVAMGAVTLRNDSDADQALVATTRLLSPEGILFRLKNRVVVPAKSTIVTEVYADKEGRESEIGPAKFTIPGLNAAKQAVIYATSEKPMIGGVRAVGIVTEEDLKLAEKELAADLKKAGAEKLSALHSESAVVYEIIKQEISADKEAGSDAEEFILLGKADVLGVFYSQTEAEKLVSDELAKRVVSEAEILIKNGLRTAVALVDYDLENKTANLKISGVGAVSLNPESQQLQKLIFFGKTKDEVRRYLLSLDHVRSVELKFTPAWIRAVPQVADHVNVVIKNVE